MLNNNLDMNDFEDEQTGDVYENTHFRIGRCHFTRDNIDESLMALETMINKFPGSRHRKSILFQMGMAYEIKGNVEQAMACYKKAALLQPIDQENTRAMKKINTLKNAQRKR